MPLVETPRLLKKPGTPVQLLRVENQQELAEALADGWLLRLQPAAPEVDTPPVAVVEHGIETPRLVKKPGPPVEYKRVETAGELAAALEDGWYLRLPVASDVPIPAPVVVAAKPVKAQEPLVEAPETPEPDVVPNEEGTASEPDAEHTEPAKKKPGRPRKVTSEK
jgi:hypothetical protein